MNSFSVSVAILMGLTGSLHCVGMCGPIIWIMPFQATSGFRRWLSIGLYHAGRISVYAAMGLLLHSFKVLFRPGIQQSISIILGVLLLLAGILSFVSSGRLSVRLPWSGLIKQQMGKFIGNPHPAALLFSGMLNGMLPCGLVYMALSMSVSADTPWQSAGLMYIFGAGTLPVLTAITLLKQKTAFLRSRSVRRMIPVIMFLFGCIFMLRGMNLGIPYLSPDVRVEQGVVRSRCCHK